MASNLWRVKSKGAVLILFLNLLVQCSFTVTVTMVYMGLLAYNDVEASVVMILSASLPTACSPFLGWLADICFGRYKVFRFGLWLMWAGVLCINVALAIGLGLKYSYNYTALFIARCGGFVLVVNGFIAYFVNALQFGIDQMPDASSDELSGYIHWFVWVMFAGGFAARVIYIVWPTIKILPKVPWAVVMIPMAMLSLALCCEFLLRRWLIIEPGSPNSLRMIYQVLKFAATHKYPIRRRAITYTEDEKPTRIDFAKEKYGGPFTTEQVEDVKTFSRIVVVLLSAITHATPLLLLVSTLYSYVLQNPWRYDGQIHQLAYSLSVFVVELILLYLFLIYPLLKMSAFSMLKRLVASAVLTALWSGTLATIQGVKPDLCIFSNLCGSGSHLFQAIYSFVVAIAAVLYLIASLEFTCAQSPYSMRGLLVGLLYSIFFLVFFIGGGIQYAWKKPLLSSNEHILYYLLFQFLCAVVGLVVLCVVARWYKRRRREEEDDQRRIVEEIYSRMLQNQGNAN